MDENPKEKQTQPTEEELHAQEASAAEQQKESAAIGNAPIALLSTVTRIFGPQQSQEQDRRYRKIVQKRVDEWKKNNPGAFRGKTFITNDNGVVMINPQLTDALHSLESQSKEDFNNKHPHLSRHYQRMESKRAYYDHKDDPAVKKLNSSISSSTKRLLGSRPVFNSPSDITTRLTESNKIRDDHYRQFVKDHPEKARYYAQQDATFKKHFEGWKEEEWQKKSKWQKRSTRLFTRQNVPEAERKTWLPKRLQKATDWYDVKKQAAKDWFNKSKFGRFLGWNRLQQNRLSQWYKNKKTALKQRLYKTRIGRAYLKYISFKEYLSNKKEEIKERVKKYLIRKLIPKSLQRFFPRNIAGKLLRKALSALAKRLPGWFGLAARGILGAKKLLSSAFRQGFRGLQKAAIALGKAGVKLAAQTLARIGATTLATTAPVWVPIAAGVAAGVVFLIIIIAIIVAIFGGGSDEESLKEVVIRLTKTGPESVVNPAPEDRNEGNPTTFTYNINVSYAGNPGSIVVTDKLPAEVIYVNAGGPGNPKYDSSSHTVTWTIPVASTGGPGQSNTVPVCGMASPPESPWPDVNRWNQQIVSAIQLAKQTEGVAVAGNVVKAIMMRESGGEELDPNFDGYTGLMQVGTDDATGGGSNCDWWLPEYDITTTQGNLNCGVQHLARGLQMCGDMAEVIGQYFTGGCDYGSSGPDGFGTTPNDYVNQVLDTYNYLNSVTDTTSCQ